MDEIGWTRGGGLSVNGRLSWDPQGRISDTIRLSQRTHACTRKLRKSQITERMHHYDKSFKPIHMKAANRPWPEDASSNLHGINIFINCTWKKMKKKKWMKCTRKSQLISITWQRRFFETPCRLQTCLNISISCRTAISQLNAFSKCCVTFRNGLSRQIQIIKFAVLLNTTSTFRM